MQAVEDEPPATVSKPKRPYRYQPYKPRPQIRDRKGKDDFKRWNKKFLVISCNIDSLYNFPWVDYCILEKPDTLISLDVELIEQDALHTIVWLSIRYIGRLLFDISSMRKVLECNIEKRSGNYLMDDLFDFIDISD